MTASSRTLTRRDYVLACPCAHQMIKQVKVSYVGTFATHHIVQTRIKPQRNVQRMDKLRRHAALAQSFDSPDLGT